MKKYEKEIAKAQLQDEARTIRELKQVYKKAQEDVELKIAHLGARTDLEHAKSIIYQSEFQGILKHQIDSGLHDLDSKTYKTINGFLEESYMNGYIGNMYSLTNQGVPMILPVDQAKVIRALQTDSKLSTRHYEEDPLKGRLAEDVDRLKTSIRAELSRGILNGSTWQEIAYKIAKGMNNPITKAMNDAMRIARTEGHRVNQEGFLHAGDEAKKKGADIVKQWDATLDSKTRPWHMEADGQIREWNDKFIVGGEQMDAPSVGGSARNVCNCRCQLLQRARWSLDEDELKTLQQRAEFFGLDKTDSFEEFKKTFLNLPEGADTMDIVGALTSPVAGSDEKYQKLLEGLKINGVDYRPVEQHKEKLTQEEIIKALAGGDRTKGSCASVGLAYMGQTNGWNVLDFRDGSSRNFFSRSSNLFNLSKMQGMVATYYGDVAGKTSCTLANNFLKTCEAGKEYYLCVGRHASIVRKTDEGVLQYLELQSATRSGWTNFNGNPRYTLTQRFGCSSSSGHGERWDFMLNITDSDFDNDEFKSLLGYINTAEESQVKGVSGTIK